MLEEVLDIQDGQKLYKFRKDDGTLVEIVAMSLPEALTKYDSEK